MKQPMRAQSHAGITVRDLQAAKAELKSRGVTFYSDINAVDAGWFVPTGKAGVLAGDPPHHDGIAR